jgi:tetratricopeptide (TPR) repeat protein
MGAFRESLEWAGQSLEIADRLGDEALAAPPVNLMGRVYWNWTDFPRASKLLERSVEQMNRLGNRTEEATAAAAAGFAFGCMGEFERALHYGDRGVALSQEIHNPFAESSARQNRAFVLEHRGALDRAIAEYAAARQIADGVGDRFRLYIIKILEGRAHALNGNPAFGRGLLEEAQAFAQQIGTKFFLAWQKTCLAGCLLPLGDYAGALALCEEAIDLAGQTGERFIRALAQRARAEALVNMRGSADALAAAARSLDEVLEVLGELGARPELARSHLSYARVLTLASDARRAREFRERARALFREMDLTWDLRRLDEEIATLNPGGR